MKTVGILLAAGHSRRFGDADKLLAPYQGRPLVEHAADALKQAPLDALVAVVASDAVQERLNGFHCVAITRKDHLQSESLRAGLEQAEGLEADRAVVVLGDMPLVTPSLITAVMELAGDTRTSAAFNGQRPMPPACFPVHAFEELKSAQGDKGAAELLRRLPRDQLVPVGADVLADVDVPADLSRLPGARQP